MVKAFVVLTVPGVERMVFIAGHFALAMGQFNSKGQAAPERQNLCSNLRDQSF